MHLLKVIPLLLLLATSAAAQTNSSGAVAIKDAWARATPPGAAVAAGYLTIANTGSEPDRLVSIVTPQSEKAEIHKSTLVEGVARMRPVADLRIPPGEAVTLAPGGLHVMFIKPKARLREGERIEATLTFEEAGPIKVEFAVQGMGARGLHTGH